MPSDSEKGQISWRGFRKISADVRNSHALKHVCGIGGPTRTECVCSDLACRCTEILARKLTKVIENEKKISPPLALSADMKQSCS